MSLTATLRLFSPSITNDVLNVELIGNLTVDGTDPITELVGVSRRSGLNSRTVLLAAATYANGGIIYIKNLDTTYANKFLLEVGAAEVGVVNGGEFYLIPWNADADFSVTADEAASVLEFALFVK
jgi:hypothetical protein